MENKTKKSKSSYSSSSSSKKLKRKNSYSSGTLEVKKIDGIFRNDPKNFELFIGNPEITNKWLLNLQDIYKKTSNILFRNITNWLPLEYYDQGAGLFYSEYTTFGLARCITELNDSKHRYIVYLLVIRTIKGSFHANSIIIDLNERKVWRFEPNGKGCSFYSQPNLDKDLKKYYQMFDIEYIPPDSYQHKYGPQYREIDANFEKIPGQADGFCAAWSLYFIHIFLENNKNRKNISVEQLKDVLNDQEPLELAIDIRGYMGYIMRNIKNMPKIAKDGEGDDKHDLET